MTSEPAPAQVAAPKIQALSSDRLKKGDFAFTAYDVRPQAGTALKDVLRPDYWKHVARTVRLGDEFRIVPDDQLWYARLYVTHATVNEVFVSVIAHGELGATIDPEKLHTDDYEVKHRGRAGWSVLRKKDGAVIKDGFARREDAAAHMVEHAKAFLKAA